MLLYWWTYVEWFMINTIVYVLSIVSHLFGITNVLDFGKMLGVCVLKLWYFNTRGYKYLVQVKDSLIFSSPLLFNYVPWGAHTWFKIVNKLTELLKDHQMIIHLEFRAKYWMGFEKIATYPPDSYVKLPDWKSLEF